jgi:hypothetical protein
VLLRGESKATNWRATDRFPNKFSSFIQSDEYWIATPLQPRNKWAFEHNAITIGPVLFSTLEKLNIFYIRYDDDVGNNGSNGNYTVTMVTASSKSNIFFLCCIFVSVIWGDIDATVRDSLQYRLKSEGYVEGVDVNDKSLYSITPKVGICCRVGFLIHKATMTYH